MSIVLGVIILVGFITLAVISLITSKHAQFVKRYVASLSTDVDSKQLTQIGTQDYHIPLHINGHDITLRVTTSHGKLYHNATIHLPNLPPWLNVWISGNQLAIFHINDDELSTTLPQVPWRDTLTPIPDDAIEWMDPSLSIVDHQLSVSWLLNQLPTINDNVVNTRSVLSNSLPRWFQFTKDLPAEPWQFWMALYLYPDSSEQQNIQALSTMLNLASDQPQVVELCETVIREGEPFFFWQIVRRAPSLINLINDDTSWHTRRWLEMLHQMRYVAIEPEVEVQWARYATTSHGLDILSLIDDAVARASIPLLRYFIYQDDSYPHLKSHFISRSSSMTFTDRLDWFMMLAAHDLTLCDDGTVYALHLPTHPLELFSSYAASLARYVEAIVLRDPTCLQLQCYIVLLMNVEQWFNTPQINRLGPLLLQHAHDSIWKMIVYNIDQPKYPLGRYLFSRKSRWHSLRAKRNPNARSRQAGHLSLATHDNTGQLSLSTNEAGDLSATEKDTPPQ